MKRIAAVLTLTGALFGFAAQTAAFADGTVCVHAYVNLNGTEQTLDQCTPV